MCLDLFLGLHRGGDLAGALGDGVLRIEDRVDG